MNPHDLLWIAGADGLSFKRGAARPDWLTDDWLRRAPLVLRRETMAAGDSRLPVGVRGTTRSQRCAAYVERDAVLRSVAPEALAAGRYPSGFPALAALAALAPAFDSSGLAWGPTGGVGFLLASGLPVLRPDSDLDLLLRAPRRLGAGQAAALAALQVSPVCRIDIQVDTGHGAFALAEWLRWPSRIMLKTGAGPVLLDDPWSAP
ncbi:malonate decarboxylase holo-ACP synthase [Janthinobacterium agaricidamnosum]|uniref:Holo-ACP synthase, malonate decarboxylase-specific n=1 Tax=Janthinobacterium agaricidamnosum NBRC 102515 = DSM 9628 TaxID=1349767 RepID=W0V657_9BURK|nr:malonate decarboxylase holo-ACP synthase [Janthinobacterium agaricidamnosum]CDG83361.1 holo-ACP synthase, malonate decarboxylase-specific [Janthinobacterium agaricidamnosum NBRC 102515 = DSM 9628]